MPKTKMVQTSTLRNNMADVINEIDAKYHYMLVMRKGQPVSAMVNLDFFEDLLATNSPKYLKSIREARENYKKGEILTHEEVFGAV